MVSLALALAFMATGCAGDKALRQRQGRAARDLGERYLARNEPSRALEQFLKSLELYPDDPYLHYDLALTYDMKGKLDKVEEHLKEAIEVGLPPLVLLGENTHSGPVEKEGYERHCKFSGLSGELGCVRIFTDSGTGRPGGEAQYTLQVQPPG